MRIPDTASAGWLNGRRIRVDDLGLPVEDPAYHSGLGLFETIAVRDRALLDLELHLARLRIASRRMEIPLPGEDALRGVALRAAAEQLASHGWLEIVCTRGGRWFVFGGAMEPSEEGRAVEAVVLPWRRNPADPLAGLQTLNRAACAIGLEEARRRGADEGLWLNTQGLLAQGCTGNLFVVERRKLFTPAVREGILPGVVRALVLRAARELGFTVHEGKLRLPRLRRAGEAFLTSSLRGVQPLVRVDGRPVGGGEPGAATFRIAAAVERLRERTRAEPPTAAG